MTDGGVKVQCLSLSSHSLVTWVSVSVRLGTENSTCPVYLSVPDRKQQRATYAGLHSGPNPIPNPNRLNTVIYVCEL